MALKTLAQTSFPLIDHGIEDRTTIAESLLYTKLFIQLLAWWARDSNPDNHRTPAGSTMVAAVKETERLHQGPLNKDCGLKIIDNRAGFALGTTLASESDGRQLA